MVQQKKKKLMLHVQYDICSMELIVLRDAAGDSAAQIWAASSVLEILADRRACCDDSRIAKEAWADECKRKRHNKGGKASTNV